MEIGSKDEIHQINQLYNQDNGAVMFEKKTLRKLIKKKYMKLLIMQFF